MAGVQFKMHFCVYCDKRLSKAEIAALTELEMKHHFILCAKHLKEHRAEVQAIIDNPEHSINS